MGRSGNLALGSMPFRSLADRKFTEEDRLCIRQQASESPASRHYVHRALFKDRDCSPTATQKNGPYLPGRFKASMNVPVTEEPLCGDCELERGGGGRAG